MLGKASQIKVYRVVEMYSLEIDDQIIEAFEQNPDWDVLDIKFVMMLDTDGTVYHEALIIYKEA